VIIQKMVDAEVSGIAFTAHPVTKDKDMILIEAGFGLGEAMVSGMVTPDSYVIDKKGLTVYDFKIGKQKKMVTREGVVDVPEEKQTERKLSEEKAIALAQLCIQIENHYGVPQDIEWVLADDKICILQSRPVTTLN
jgi:pyruvate,water dikinase